MTCQREMVSQAVYMRGTMTSHTFTGLFLVVVLCVAVCCILGVVGVGYCVHHPTCHRSTSPFSDASPSFHSAQLAFSSSPEDKTGQGLGHKAGKAR